MGAEQSAPTGMDSHQVQMSFGRGAKRAHVGYAKKGKSIVKVYRKKGKTGRYFSNGRKLQPGKRVCRMRSSFGKRKACKKSQTRNTRTKRCRKKPCKKSQTRDTRTNRCRKKKKAGKRKTRAPRYSVPEPPEPAFGSRMMRPMPRFGARPMPRFGRPISGSAIRRFRPISF